LLKNLESSLSHCTKVKTHYFPSVARECVWCRLTVQSGIDMFPDFLGTDPPVRPTGPFDIERILTQVSAVSLPQPASVIPKWVGALVGADSAVAEAKRGLMANKAIGVGALIVAGAGFVVVPPFAIAWIGLGLYGLFKLFGSGIDHAPFRSAFALADQRAREAEMAFVQRIGLTELYGVRDDLEKWITSHRQLDADLNRDLGNLRSTRESRQRDAFLDRFPIRTAKISGIGPAKTATLASFGIETAADVNETAVRAVPGFGEAMTAKMMAWRRTHEARFRYNPSPSPADAQAENAVRAAWAAKRSDLQTKIHSGLAALQSGPQRVAIRAQTVDQPLMAALGERARAAHNLQLLGLSVPFSAPITITAKSPPPAGVQPWTQPPATPSSGMPACPRCGSTMIRRTARRGRHAGSGFWGCSRYPTCTGIRN
jgi:DNA-binding helix-hairpin-helix protein with protein kinase domain